MLSTQDLGVKVTVPLPGCGLCICLAANLDPLVVGEGDVFRDERVIEGIEVECGQRDGCGALVLLLLLLRVW